MSQLNKIGHFTSLIKYGMSKRVLLDAGSSLNIISLDVLDDFGFPREKI